MAITRYTFRNPTLSPWRDLEDVSHRLARMFETNDTENGIEGGTWYPAVNVQETNDELLLTAELPGMKQEEVSIEVENSVLRLSGQKTEERTEGDEESRYHVWERRYGTFQRSFTLPRTVRAEGIQATFENGVLRIHMPKAAEAKARKISIEAAK